jgi:integrase
MAGKLHKLSARTVAALTRPGRHSDGGGLYLFVSRDAAALRRRWVFRFTQDRKTREMGLGPANGVSLAEARKLAAAARNEVANGRDPIEARDAGRRASRGRKAFGECATALIAAKQSEWRNARHRQQWRVTLETYCAPIWAMPVDEVDTEAVLGVLRPLWQTRPETASRLRGRIEAVLDAAKAQGLRQGENPARWRGHLDKLLPKRQKLSRGHLAAMPYNRVPELVARLRGRPGLASSPPSPAEPSISAMALEFLILTAARSGEVLGARWSEIDLDAKVWTVPASRMKAAREHRVPLSGRAMAILARLDKAKTGEFVFFGQRPGKPLSPAALTMVLRRLQINRATIHGFRSSFRDWAGNETHYPRELAEAALAHVIGDKAEQAYHRSDALEKRRALMEAWAAYCEPNAAPNVVVLSRKTLPA